MNKELLSNVIEQKIGYYKLSLENNPTNMYGETSEQKNFLDPVLISCLITSGDFATTDYNELKNVRRNNGFAFLRDHLIDADIFPERGDVILWNEDFYEVDNVSENQYLGGKVPEYQYLDYLQKYGSSFSVICEAHLTNPTKLGIKLYE